MTRTRIGGAVMVALVALVALALPGIASARDRDHARKPDTGEKRSKLNTKKNDARRDKDRDGLRNIDEYRAGTSPRDRDSDDDGTRDDNEQAGRVESFDEATGTLTITLFGGGTLTGIVNDSTERKCEDEDDDNTATTGDTRGDGTPEDDKVLRDGADDPAGDDSGDDSGDDHGGDRDRTCPAGSLKEGALVKEAEVTGNGTQTIFKEIELG
jgi:hypothetical protein